MWRLCTCSVWCVLLENFVFLGRVHVITTEPISTVQTMGQGFCILLEQNENSCYKL
ncbi:unnamed protein product [Staurois parvus]|uniref:Uncharacterized protein n=1 Tax=Staurois parvus TaxID=386267 RepID=A0ABN9FAT8_9NEOB|nr:unnamed protein product [Staurois parvus]